MSESQSKSSRILLVDDEEDLVTFLAHRLRKQGFTVTATTSGADAVTEVERSFFDVAVLDLKMPGMDGMECMRKVKEIQPFMQVIMLTGHGSYESALEAGSLRAHRYLIKPYEFDVLLDEIREACHAKETQLAEGFQEESRKLHEERSLSPRELLRRQEGLRRKYEVD